MPTPLHNVAKSSIDAEGILPDDTYSTMVCWNGCEKKAVQDACDIGMCNDWILLAADLSGMFYDIDAIHYAPRVREGSEAKNASADCCKGVFRLVGAEGVEPPTLCL